MSTYLWTEGVARKARKYKRRTSSALLLWVPVRLHRRRHERCAHQEEDTDEVEVTPIPNLVPSAAERGPPPGLDVLLHSYTLSAHLSLSEFPLSSSPLRSLFNISLPARPSARHLLPPPTERLSPPLPAPASSLSRQRQAPFPTRARAAIRAAAAAGEASCNSSFSSRQNRTTRVASAWSVTSSFLGPSSANRENRRRAG
jgi:hypothetical protein